MSRFTPIPDPLLRREIALSHGVPSSVVPKALPILGGDGPSPSPTMLQSSAGSRGTSRTSAVALMDAPNIRCCLYEAVGNRHPRGKERLDLKVLRKWIVDRYTGKRFLYVTRHVANSLKHIPLYNYVRGAGWRWVSASKASYGDNNDPVDCYIIASLECMRRSLGHSTQRTAVVIGHDHGYSDSLNLFLQAGGQVVLVGLIEFFSRSLLELADHPNCTIADLEFDVHALKISRRDYFDEAQTPALN